MVPISTESSQLSLHSATRFSLFSITVTAMIYDQVLTGLFHNGWSCGTPSFQTRSSALYFNTPHLLPTSLSLSQNLLITTIDRQIKPKLPRPHPKPSMLSPQLTSSCHLPLLWPFTHTESSRVPREHFLSPGLWSQWSSYLAGISTFCC